MENHLESIQQNKQPKSKELMPWQSRDPIVDDFRCRFVASLHPALRQAMSYQSLKILEMSEPC